MSEASIPVDITRMDADGAQSVTDAVAREEPLEIRDFSTATEWERFAARVEQRLRACGRRLEILSAARRSFRKQASQTNSFINRQLREQVS